MPINCTIVGGGNTNDEADDGGDVTEIAVTGELVFVAQLPEGQPALAPTEGATGKSYWVRTFSGCFDTDGVLKNEPGGTPGVRIWANDPAFNLEQLPYLVYAPNGLRANGKRVEFRAFVFNAPDSDVTRKLSELQPVPSAAAEGITRGPRGPALTAASFDGAGNIKLESEDGTNFFVAIPDGFIAFIDNGDGTWGVGS